MAALYKGLQTLSASQAQNQQRYILKGIKLSYNRIGDKGILCGLAKVYDGYIPTLTDKLWKNIIFPYLCVRFLKERKWTQLLIYMNVYP